MTRWLDGRKVGRNEPCPCASGLKFKNCHMVRVTEPTPDGRGRVASYVTAEDVWPTIDDGWEQLIGDLRNLNGQWLCEILGALGGFLHSEYRERTRTREEEICSAVFPQRIHALLRCWLASHKRQKVFARQNVLSAILCRMAAEGDCCDTTVEDATEIGPILLRLNSLLTKPTSRSRIAQEPGLPSATSLVAFLPPLYLVASEPEFGMAIARYRLMYRDGFEALRQSHPKVFIDFEKEFFNATRLGTHEVLTIGLGIWSLVTQNSRSEFISARGTQRIRSEQFRETSVKARRATHDVLELLSLSWNEHAERAADVWREEHPYDVRQFYDCPLVRLDDGSYFLTDVPLLEARITDGLYWIVFMHVDDATKKRLRTAFGMVFEWYVRKLVSSYRAEGYITECWTEDDGAPSCGDGVCRPDVVVTEGRHVFVVEATTMSVRPSTFLSGTLEDLRAGFLNQWVGDDSRGKIVQLRESCEALAAGMIAFPGLAIPEKASIWPVLLTHRTLPQLGNVTSLYRTWLVEGGIPRHFVDRVTFLDISEFERLVAWKAEGVSWVPLFELKHSSELENDPMQHVITRVPREPRQPFFLERAFEDAFSEMSRTLFAADQVSAPEREC